MLRGSQCHQEPTDHPVGGTAGSDQAANRAKQNAAASGGLCGSSARYCPGLPAEVYPEVVIIIDNAPWHRGPIVDAALAAHPHLTFYRLPSYSPQLNPIERFWRILRRRATHNRLFTTRSELRQTLRHNLCYYQSLWHKVLSLLESKRKKAKK